MPNYTILILIIKRFEMNDKYVIEIFKNQIIKDQNLMLIFKFDKI